MNTFFIIKQKSVFKPFTGIILLLCGFVCSIPLYGQQAKGSLQLADEYFAAGEYYTAAHFYGQYLDPAKKQQANPNFPLNAKGKRAVMPYKNISRTAALFKQAESYRLANYWQEAATAYKECFEKDSIAYADALYWLAVCKQSLSNYEEAEEILKKYLSAGDNSKYKKEAEDGLQTLQFIRRQLTRADSILYKVKKLEEPGSSDKGLFAPAYISNNQFIVSSTEKDSVSSKGINPYHSRLFYATIHNGSVTGMEPLAIAAKEPLINQGAASISADGKFLYLTQWKKVNGQTVSAIYLSTKTNDGWSSPVLLSSVNQEGYNSKQPFCTPDGKYIFFSSDRPGGSGKFDIWYAPLNNDGHTGEAVNAGPVINTGADEQAPFYHSSSATLVFSSNAKQGMGGYDLFSAKGNETAWTKPENMGHPINSSRDDIYFFAQENERLLNNAVFSSDRGTGCCLETYTVSKTPKDKLLTGVIYGPDNIPLDSVEVILKDITGKTWKTTTDINGNYVFDLKKEDLQDLTLTISKEKYKDSTVSVSIKNTDESDLLTDKLAHSDLYLEKIPEPVVEKLVIKAENVVTVFFDFDKSNLKPEAVEKLDSIYRVMLDYPSATLQISGYTDGLGTDEYNKVLSDKRAKSCADYLVKKGIEAGRISFESFGECCPLEMEIINGRDNAEGRSRNRRALINVKKD